jgi:hypothetical protein
MLLSRYVRCKYHVYTMHLAAQCLRPDVLRRACIGYRIPSSTMVS